MKLAILHFALCVTTGYLGAELHSRLHREPEPLRFHHSPPAVLEIPVELETVTI